MSANRDTGRRSRSERTPRPMTTMPAIEPATEQAETVEPAPVPLQRGERVDLQIAATFEHDYDGETTFRLAPHGQDRTYRLFVTVPSGHPDITYRRRLPVDGEPQEGDVWRNAKGSLFFARTLYLGRESGTAVVLIPTGISPPYYEWPDVHAGPKGPITLLYRPDPVEPVEDDDEGGAS